MEEEIWVLIAGADNRYEISNLGRVRSLYNSHGTRRDKILKPAMDKKGYLRCALSIGGKLRTFKVHRIVATTFIPNPKGLPQVNHKNGIKDDNRVVNLEWVTNSQNQQHAQEVGLQRNVPVLIKNVETGEEIKFMSISAAAKFLGVNRNKGMERRLKTGLKFYRKAEKYAVRYVDI